MEYQSAAKKGKTLISSFFKKRDRQASEDTSIPTVLTMQHQSSENLLFPNIQIPSCSSPRDDHQSSSTFIERDPGKRKQICEYHVNVRDEIRRSYLNMGPYQPDMLEYPGTKFGSQNRRFQKKWFQKFYWLEYSPSTNKAYCFYCFLFLNDVNSSNISALDPKNSFDSFNSDDICKLAKKFYPGDFTDQEIVALEYELIHYKLDVMQNLKVSTLVELCQQLTESGRSSVYVMLTRLIYLVLTLPVSTATTERAFSAMKHVKTALRNKMEDDFLADCLTLYIERDLAKHIDVNSIINEFYVLKSRRAQLR
ncbi:uncharacterized protein LOC142544722 [Primulina tabacum]|uniref:uncharacterized protein LOC142544722 n=1 Tax=Primulina tabacum TaxID=48773 RepID=UPI003F59A33C